jgi:hypothetical protein
VQSNPFHHEKDSDRHSIWQMLVAVDSEAFVLGDWSMIEGYFDAEHFEGIRCALSANPNDWKLVFPRLSDYRDAWLAASRDFLANPSAGMTHLEAIDSRCRLTEIEVAGERALAHKKFTTGRQTLYRLHKRGRVWKIVGFLGQLPLDET